MLMLRDVMTKDVLTVSPETTVREAMELFARRRIGSAPVMSGSKIVGIVSAADLVALTSGLSAIPASPVYPNDLDSVAGTIMADDMAGFADPVSIAFTDFWDDAGTEDTQRTVGSDGPESNMLEDYWVSDAMTRAPLITLPSNTRVEAAAVAMRDARIHHVLVVDDNVLVGIVSALDVAVAVADGRLTRRTLVFR